MKPLTIMFGDDGTDFDLTAGIINWLQISRIRGSIAVKKTIKNIQLCPLHVESATEYNHTTRFQFNRHINHQHITIRSIDDVTYFPVPDSGHR